MKIGQIGKQEFESSQLGLQDYSKLGFSLDSVVKTAILTTLAGYLEKNTIKVYGSSYSEKKYLESFLSYVLNDKRAAPRNFNLKINYQDKEIQSSDKVNDIDCLLSFSGGADSTAGLLYALDKGYKVLPVWIGFGQKNENQELKTVKRICKKLSIKPLIIKIDMEEYVNSGWSRWKLGIIPARNLLFASISASIISSSTKKNPTIYICAHKEEITPTNTDKSSRFYKTTTKLFSNAYNRKITVTTPFAKYTKPEIISYWSRFWIDKYKVTPHDTVSCYYGNNCGNCKACINRAIAFSCAGMKPEQFEQNPFTDSKNLIQSAYIDRFEELDIDRRVDFIYTLKENLAYLPKSIQDFININYPKYKKQIDKNRTDLLKIIIK